MTIHSIAPHGVEYRPSTVTKLDNTGARNKQAVSLVWAVLSPPPSYLDGREQKKRETERD